MEALKKTLDPIAGTGNSVTGIINLFVNDPLEQVETKWNNASWPDLEKIFKLVQKIGMMWLSQDKNSLDTRLPNRAVH